MKNNINKGGILTVTLLIGLFGVSFVLGFYGWAMNRNYYNNRRIAKVKAFYNAETGMARKAYEYLCMVYLGRCIKKNANIKAGIKNINCFINGFDETGPS